MSKYLSTDSNFIVLSEFYDNHVNGKYKYDTEYQREEIWNLEKKRFLVDTILKNFPIPPIFLRMYIDDETGATRYDVIDGKQRLTTIIAFIEEKINVPDDFGNGIFGEEALNGKYFSELEQYGDYKKRFWRYKIPVIYVDNSDNEIIKEVFDRLNRNGMPLLPQELRHAKYSQTDFYMFVEKMSNLKFWTNRLKDLETKRMENVEFVSELIFLLLEKKIIAYTKEELDELYERWISTNVDYSKLESEVIKCTDYMSALDLDYEKFKIGGVSHIYGIWSCIICCLQSECNVEDVKEALEKFYTGLRQHKENENINIYSQSMSSSTKQRPSRVKRLNALISYLNSEGIDVRNILK